jgi:PII-like signaling protein
VSDAATKLSVHFNERDRTGEQFLADALIDLYERHRLHTSVLLRGIQGFGRQHRLHGDRLLTSSESLPAVSIVVDHPDRIERALPDVLALAGHRLVTLAPARLHTAGELHRIELDDRDHALSRLTLYGGRSARSGGQAGYVAAIELLRAAGALQASVLLAVDGTLHGERRRARFFARNSHVPLMLQAIGDRRVLAAALPALAGLIDEPVVTLELVQVCKSDGRTLGSPAGSSGADIGPSGLTHGRQLTITLEEQAAVDGRPLYLELVRALGAAGAAGVTVLRGVRGFYAGREPFADSLLSLRRNAPVHVIAVDAPSQVLRWWPVVDQLTSRAALITTAPVRVSDGARVPPRSP